MTKSQSKNLQKYALYAGISVTVGVLTALAQQLPGNIPINWRDVASAGVSSLLAVATMLAGAINLPRLGSERLAENVDVLKAQGVPKRDMIVIDGNPDGDALDVGAEQDARIADILEARMRARRATPAEEN